MMKLVSNVVSEKKLRDAQLRGLKLFSDTVIPTYGPMGGYSTYSDYVAGSKDIVGNYTKDGFTVLKHIKCDKPIESLIKDDIRNICTQVIKSIGDGTTSATILSYYIFKGLVELIEDNNLSKRKVIKYFKEIIKEGIEIIEQSKRECTLDDIYKIAYTSLDGNEDMAKTIQNIYKEAGMNAYIDVSPSNTKETFVKIYGGMVYNAGFTNPCFINKKNSTCELVQPHIYIFESPIDTPEMSNILRMIFDQEITQPMKLMEMDRRNGIKSVIKINPTVVICPVLSRDENSFLDNLETYFNNIENVESRPPFCIVTNLNNDNGYLLDIRAMTGAKFIKKYIDPEAYEKDKIEGLAPTEENLTSFAGTSEKVIVDALSIKIINPVNKFTVDEDGKYVLTDYYNNYVDSLKSLLSKYEDTREELVKIAEIKRRINLLGANMVDLYVGGIGTTDRMVLSDAIEDAVLNCRSAAVEGVCNAANYEGLVAFNKLAKKYTTQFDQSLTEEDHININNKLDNKEDLTEEELEKLEASNEAYIAFNVASVLTSAYFDLVKLIYLPYCDDDEDKANSIIATSIASKDDSLRKPFNIMTESYDGNVLTSAKTEPAILDSISRIITTLFNTNQFLVPDPRFNIYAMEEEDEKIEKVQAELESVPPTVKVNISDV